MIRFYIRVVIKEVKFNYQVCNIGSHNCLNFDSLLYFFNSFEIETDNFERLVDIYNKLIDENLTGADMIGFRKLLCDLYAEYTNESFVCEDKYGEVKSFNEIIESMTNDKSEFIKYSYNEYNADNIRFSYSG
jgi:hypothetical protein